MFRAGDKSKVNYSQSFNAKSDKPKPNSGQYFSQRSTKTNASFHGRKVSVLPRDQSPIVQRNRFFSAEERSRRKSARLSQTLTSGEDELPKHPALKRSKTTFIGEDKDFKLKSPSLFQRAASFRASVSKIFRKGSSPARKESTASKTFDGSSRSGSIDFLPAMTDDNLKKHLTLSSKPPIKNSKPKQTKAKIEEMSGSFEYISMDAPRPKPDQNRNKEEEYSLTSNSSVFVENEMYQSSSLSSRSVTNESVFTLNSETNEKNAKLMTSLDDVLDEFNTISKKFDMKSRFTSDDDIKIEIRKNARRLSFSRRLSKSLTAIPSNGIFYEELQKPSKLLPEYITNLTKSLQKLNNLEERTNQLKKYRENEVSQLNFHIFSTILFYLLLDTLMR